MGVIYQEVFVNLTVKERAVRISYKQPVDPDDYDRKKGWENLKQFYLRRVPIPESELREKK